MNNRDYFPECQYYVVRIYMDEVLFVDSPVLRCLSFFVSLPGLMSHRKDMTVIVPYSVNWTRRLAIL